MNWFQDLTGANEDIDNIKDIVDIVEDPTNNEIILLCPESNKAYTVGQLHILPLSSLKGLAVMNKPYIYDPTTVYELVESIEDVYNDPQNKNALYQVASQFNGLEMANPELTREHGVSIYEYDGTQGPKSAMCCGAATIYRNYFHEEIDTLKDVAELLDNDTNNFWTMKNGYALMNDDKLDELNDKIDDIGRTTIKNEISFPIQWNTQVTSNGNKHIVSQIFCSALPVSYSIARSNQQSFSLFETPDQKYKPFASLILEAAYEATLATALRNTNKTGDNRVFLTMLGGGAFGNDENWIIEAMEDALEKYEGCGLQVHIVSYLQSNPNLKNLLQY